MNILSSAMSGVGYWSTPPKGGFWAEGWVNEVDAVNPLIDITGAGVVETLMSYNTKSPSQECKVTIEVDGLLIQSEMKVGPYSTGIGGSLLSTTNGPVAVNGSMPPLTFNSRFRLWLTYAIDYGNLYVAGRLT